MTTSKASERCLLVVSRYEHNAAHAWWQWAIWARLHGSPADISDAFAHYRAAETDLAAAIRDYREALAREESACSLSPL